MNNEVMVSVACITYNHEKYIRQCLDSLLMQNTNFKYEIIVHDDASTDNTANIIREYEQKYPEIIKPIYQSENQYSKGIFATSTYVVPKVKGKYMAHCEGDDFWIDPYKLQKQFDIMEANPDCSICVHKVLHVYEDGSETGKYQPNSVLGEGKMNLDDYFKLNISHPFQTTSYFLRADIKKIYTFNPPEFVKKFSVGDVPTILFSLMKGNLYYLNEVMSCYRIFSKGSWTSRGSIDINMRLISYKKTVDAYEAFNEYSNYRYKKYVDDIIIQNKFLLLLTSKKYKSCLNRKYHRYFNKCLKPKEKIAVILYAFFPFLEKILKLRK